MASIARRSDLHMLQLLHSYPECEATSWKLAGQLWCLSQDLILLSLYDAEVSLTTKCEIVNAAHGRDGEKKPTRRAHVDMQHRRLVDLCFHVQQQYVCQSTIVQQFFNNLYCVVQQRQLHGYRGTHQHIGSDQRSSRCCPHSRYCNCLLYTSPSPRD